jgi:Phage integrase family
MAGVDLRTVAELMGHSGIQMTMRYAHLAPQHNRAPVDRLDSLSQSRDRRQKPGSAERNWSLNRSPANFDFPTGCRKWE